MVTNKILSNRLNSTKRPEAMEKSNEVAINRLDIRRQKIYLYLTVIKSVVCLSIVLLLMHFLGRNADRVRGGFKDSNGKTILLWSEDDHFGEWSYLQCGCVVTSKRDYAGATIDAIVFNGDQPYSFKGLDQIKHTPNFLAVFTLRNPLSLAPNPLSVHGESVFNFTMTYRLDSDLIWSDYYFSEGLEESLKKHLAGLRPRLEAKSRLVFYMVYQVDDYSLPESLYLQELRKYIELDAYIKCYGHHDCGHYKFMLIFEPSSCPDYVKPQIYKALDNYVVPVVIGGSNLSNLVPPGSYVNSDDFRSPKQLAEHLEMLSTQPQLYEQFFWWHSKYRLQKNSRPFCALCLQLGRARRQRQPDEFLKWWTGYQCPNHTDRLAWTT